MQIESYFSPPSPEITSVVLDPENGRATVRWRSVPGREYSVERSSDLVLWEEIDDNLSSPGLEGVWEDPELLGEREFYRIVDNEAE